MIEQIEYRKVALEDLPQIIRIANQAFVEMGPERGRCHYAHQLDRDRPCSAGKRDRREPAPGLREALQQAGLPAHLYPYTLRGSLL